MKKIRDELKDLKQFGSALAILLFMFGIVNLLKHRTALCPWFLWASFIAATLVLMSPASMKPVYGVFMKIAHALGWFNTRVILILIYFFIITPIALILKILGKDPLRKKIEKDAPGYWIKRDIKPSKEALEKQF